MSQLLLRRLFISSVHFLAFIFLILVLIGNTNAKPVIRSTYFLRIDLSNVIPRSVPNAVLINSIARSLGLHDFYQVGLWNYCAGYLDTGIAYCSEADSWYWFNPAEVLLSELLAGATLALPAKLTDILDLIRIVSHWMFGLFITGTIFNFLSIFVAPFSISSKVGTHERRRRRLLRSGPPFVISLITVLSTTAASIVATVMFKIFKNVMTGREELNIDGAVGTPMLAYMWTATGLTIIGFAQHAATCCCSGRRKKAAEKEGVKGEKETAELTSPRRSAVKRRVGWINAKFHTK